MSQTFRLCLARPLLAFTFTEVYALLVKDSPELEVFDHAIPYSPIDGTYFRSVDNAVWGLLPLLTKSVFANWRMDNMVT